MEILETERLVLRRSRQVDEPAIFSRYAADLHVDHHVSCRVLEKPGFVRESIRAGRPFDFPNLPPNANRAAAIYTLTL